jgi:hypothetical protein
MKLAIQFKSPLDMVGLLFPLEEVDGATTIHIHARRNPLLESK